MRTERVQRAVRVGFTLLEVTLSMAIAVVLLGALYAALTYHLKNAEAGRDLVEHSTLARALLARMTSEIGGALNLDDAARYRYTQNQSGAAAGGGGATTPAASTTPAATGQTGASNSPTSGVATNAVTLPLGLQGNATSLTVLVSRVPTEAWANADGVPLASDLRLISYWFVEGKGLYRQEIKAVTSADAAPLLPPNGSPPDDATLIVAAEVGSLQFRYWGDPGTGLDWQSDWDGTTLGADGVTPIGPPRAVEITLGLIPRKAEGAPDADQPPLELFTHVVGIASANGDPAPTSTSSGSGTTP